MFACGIASGEPTATSIVLWTRVDDPATAQVTWWVRDESGALVAEGPAAPDPQRDATTRVLVDGLLPGAAHTYGFAAGGSASHVGRFRTLPDRSTELRFAVVSCAKYNAGYFNVYRQLARRDDLDFILHLGDYIYEAANKPPASQTPGADIGRPFDPAHECRTLADYRRRYRQYRGDPDVRAVHARHAMMATIDDHELADNAWSGGAAEHDESRDGPWVARKANALRAWADWMPLTIRPAIGDPIWRRHDAGPLAQIVLTETRTNRTSPGVPEAQRALFGSQQRTWLREQLIDVAQSHWTFLAVPSMVAPVHSERLHKDACSALKTLKLLDPSTGLPFHDRWDSFALERRHLLETISGSPSDVIVLSGDVHIGVDAVLRTEDGAVAAHEWVAPSITSQNLDDKLGWEPRTRSQYSRDRFVEQTADVKWCDFDSHGWLEVGVAESHARCAWWMVDTVREPSDEAFVVRESVVERGDARRE